jgi:hypothetical protein
LSQASFLRDGIDVSDLYFADRRAHPETKMFTVSPKPFVLPSLVGTSPLTTVQATIFRGHLERGGEPIRGLDPVTVNLSHVVHFHKFDPAVQAPSTLEYLAFGRGSELFLAHFISKPPDFDQILSVTVTGKQFTDDELSTAFRISIPDRKNTPAERLKATENVTAVTPGGDKLQIEGLTEFYFEEGELRMPATFDPTAEEKKAGFS